MLDHMSIGVRDVAVSRRFYDAVFAALGYRCVYEGDGYAGYGDTAAEFWINHTAQPVKENPESGLHVSFIAADRAAVDAFHATGLAMGGKDNGPPGPRPHYGATYYAGFIVDPDGYRIEAHTEAG